MSRTRRQPRPTPEATGDKPEPSYAQEPPRSAQEEYEEGEHLEPGELLWFDWTIEDEGVHIDVDVRRGDAGLAITQLTISAPLPIGITGQMLRKVQIGEILRTARADLADQAALPPEPTDEVYEARDTTASPPAGSRTMITDDLLRHVASAYLEETAPGKDRAAIKRLAEHFGRPEGTIRSWVSRARKEEWLGPGSKGRMGAEAGPKLMAWQLDELKRRNPGLISHVQVSADGTVTDVSKPESSSVSGDADAAEDE